MSDFGLGITLALKDMFSRNAERIERSYSSLDNTIIWSELRRGSMVMGAGLALMAVPSALISSTFETQKALGELRSLGVRDLKSLSQAAEDFSNKWSGTTKAEFIAASYDIRSGISSLKDQTVRITLKAYDAGSKMKGRGSQKIWKNKTYSQIAREIAGKYHLKAVVSDTNDLVECEPQGNKSDFGFLDYLAEKIGFKFNIQNSELHFYKQDLNKKPKLVLTYQGQGGLLISFRPKVKAQASKAEGTETKAVGFRPYDKTVGYL